MPRRPFTQREHLGTGALISQAQNDLTSVALAVQEAYGLTAGRPLLRLNGTTAREYLVQTAEAILDAKPPS